MTSVHDLDYAAVIEKLFAGITVDGGSAYAGPTEPSPGWRVRKPPSPPLPIDAEITALLTPKHRNSARVVWSARCPYYAVRVAIARAADTATKEWLEKDSRERARDDLLNIAKQARALATKNKTFGETFNELDRLLWRPSYGGEPRLHYRTADQVRGASHVALGRLDAAASALLDIAAMADEARSVFMKTGDKSQLWERSFIRSMAIFWYSLTGNKASSAVSGPFDLFLREAFKCIGSDIGAKENWNSQTRRALKDLARRRQLEHPNIPPSLTLLE